MAVKAGQKLGNWELVENIDKGGNGSVWKAKNSGKDICAIKIIHDHEDESKRKKRRQRFLDESEVAQANSDVGGILPVIDSNSASSVASGTNQLWYVMPLAERVKIDGSRPTETVKVVIAIATTMAELHQRGISHRDIKPPNILMYKGNPVIADFGIARFPGKANITGKTETLGPYATMPPEARKGAQGTDGIAMDVFELAKTLWIYLVGKSPAFEGQYHPDGSDALKEFLQDINYEPLDRLLEVCTDSDPTKRPSMKWFKEELQSWVQLEEDFQARGAYQWSRVPHRLFPLEIPETARWKSLESIIRVLATLGDQGHFNHMFYPSGGGLSLSGAIKATEDDCLELLTQRGELVDVAKPRFLSFEYFPNNPEWNYFWLELKILDPSGVYSTPPANMTEEVCEISAGQYIDIIHWQHREYRGHPLPSSARPVTRLLSGSLVIVMTQSIYNQIDDYSGRHERLGYEEFRKQIQECSEL